MANPALCAICGFRQARSRDHIPPRAIFPRPLPLRLVTVPACFQCNNGASQQDEHFRVYLALNTAYRNDEATRLWRDEAMRTLQKNAKLNREVQNNTQRVKLQSEDGSIEEAVAIRWPAAAYRSVIERIVRGLFYHHFREALGSKAECQVEMLRSLPASFVALTANWQADHVGDEIFRYRFGRVEGHVLRSYWILQFFENHWATVETFPMGEGPTT